MISIVTNRPEYFEKLGWTEFSTIEFSLETFEEEEIVIYDKETTGLGFMFSKIWCIQLGTIDDEHQFVIDTVTVDIDIYKNLLENKVLLGQNLLFDIVFLFACDIRPKNIWDTYVNEFLLTAGLNPVENPRNLGHIVKKYTGIEVDKDDQKDIAQTGLNSISKILYSGNDVRGYLYDVYTAQRAQLALYDLIPVADLHYRFIRVAAYQELCGFHLVKTKWRAKMEEDVFHKVTAQKALATHMLEAYPDLSEAYGIEGKVHDKFSWTATKTVGELFKDIGIDITNPKDPTKETIDIGVLIPQAKDFPILNIYKKYKEAEKRINTYGLDWIEDTEKSKKKVPSALQSDGRIHTKLKLMVDTGRTGSGNSRGHNSFKNLQNVSADQETRGCFEGQGPNRLIVCDYSSQESVLLADMSQESNLIDFYLNGGADLHSYAAKLIYQDKVGDTPIEDVKKLFPEERQNSKAGNFCLPTDTTEVLTVDGWKFRKDLTIGQLIYTYNQDSKELEIMPITDLPTFRSSEVKELYVASQFKFECTDNHRWVTWKRKWGNRKERNYGIVETVDLNSEHNIIRSAPYRNKGTRSDLSLKEIGLLAWITSDGYWKWSDRGEVTSSSKGARKGIKLSISQKKYKHYVERCLEGLEYNKSTRDDDVSDYTIRSQCARDFIRKLGFDNINKHDVDYSAFMHTLSFRQREYFLINFTKADGNGVWVDRPGERLIYQNEGNILEGIKTALVLNGYHYSVFSNGVYVGKRQSKEALQLSIRKRKHTTCQRLKVSPSRVCDVFCANNDNGTFIARQGDMTTITGNSIAYGGTGYTISQNLNISPEEGERIYKAYMKAFPGLDRFFKERIENMWREGFIRVPGPYGWIRFIDNFAELKKFKFRKLKRKLSKEDFNKMRKKIGAIEREALNTPTQGAAGMMSKLAGVYFLEEIERRKWWGKVKIVNFVHDEWVAEAHQKTAPKVAPVLSECMERAGLEFLNTLTIKAEAEVTKEWQH